LTDFQKFLIGILAGIFIAVLVVVGILFFKKSKPSVSAAADTQILAKIEAEKEELARLQEKIAKKEAELEQDEPEFSKQEETHKKLLNNDRDAVIDDPIKLYLRDIGKENLLTADEEVILSKAMEDGENIIKNAIKNSGVLISEVQMIAQKAFAKISSSESNKPRKELSYEDAEKKRLRQSYGEQLKPIYSDIKAYILLKKKLYDKEALASFLDDEDLQKTRKKILNYLQKIEFQTEEIEKISDHFLEAAKKIPKVIKHLSRKLKLLRNWDLEELFRQELSSVLRKLNGLTKIHQRVINPVQAQRVITPVQAQRVINPVQAQRVIAPVQVQRVIVPVQVQRVITPVQVQRVITPVQVQRVITPVQAQRVIVPVQAQRVINPVQVQEMVV